MSFSGLITLPWWGYVLITLGMTHITILSVTIFLHRHQAHRSLELHPAISHFFRFWLWLTTGMVTKEWVAVHRKHHAKVETENDPHSPQVAGINTVLWQGAELYRQETDKNETMQDYGHGTPDDWMENNLYSRFSALGVSVMLIMDFVFFGFIGITIWAIQMIWIPFFAAGVINGVGHWAGYRNFESADASTNISPIGILIGGEELHNNHHAFASSARFSNKAWEFDIGWCYIRLMRLFNLAKVKKLAPTPVKDKNKSLVDYDTVNAVITNRLNVMADYARHVVRDVYKDEMQKANASKRQLLKRGKKFLVRAESRLDAVARNHLQDLLNSNEPMQIVYEYRNRLQALWLEKTASKESLVKHLQEWCQQAEATGIRALQEYAKIIRSYTLQPAMA